ncbi:hypothetical protein KL914_002955 [Ogataea haglerorum]|uniref:Potassium channel domain-containing protein n=2 Tax=Ogataea haglerorum TaxID=1937702 RepID=A0ABQ7RHQ7_9ASCO|nr:hypothetical protein KL914_002955 [Ogataea haglerorum]KAG7758804.1 hypothetical protein KL947_002473 [Ogataea haglerorum]KAG7765852.1 hypothetical protein KL946_002032 [Ogataea haglerorum]
MSGDQSTRESLQEDEFVDSVFRSLTERTMEEPAPLERMTSQIQQYYDSLLNNADWNVANLQVRPGQPTFLIWFVFSSYFPLICGCIGPLSNLLSVASVICKWKQDKVTGKPAGADESWCYTVNSISMVCGVVANICLLLNYRRKMSYRYAQIVSVTGWFVASMMLMLLVAIYHVEFLRHEHYIRYSYSYGFWFAVFTVVLHFANFLLLSLNTLGVLLKKYPPDFNIDGVQNTLILQSMFFVSWIMWGAGMFTALLHVSYGEALYFSITTILTIGLGDFVPQYSGAQTLTLLWCIVGLVVFGLIISTIRELVMFSSASTFYWHRLQRFRGDELKNAPSNLSNQESFNRMKKASRKAMWHEHIFSALTILSAWLLFWLLGALLFSVYEGWTYHLSCYFAFLCFVTIGYGVPAPTTSGGRSFFCVWAILAIPVMTILVMNMSDFIFSSLETIQNLNILRKRSSSHSDDSDSEEVILHHLLDPKKASNLDIVTTKEYLSASSIATELANYNNPSYQQPDHCHLAALRKEPNTGSQESLKPRLLKQNDPLLSKMSQLQQIIIELRKSTLLTNIKPGFKYSFQEWNKFLSLTDLDTSSEFWLGEKSPFGFPNDEPLYFTYHFLHALDRKLHELALQYDQMN